MCAQPTPKPPRGLPFRKGVGLLWPQGPAPSPIPVAMRLDHHHHQHSHPVLLHRGLRPPGMGGRGGGTPRGHDLGDTAATPQPQGPSLSGCAPSQEPLGGFPAAHLAP
ncbi:unnamed protein product [Rangifer tarandus platyrhynchus]|uniref:Uncharacterized protein n=1 Tax=Rangifer tarandus platyrhynchus TaxID=3082113 RepID=A0ACB1KDU9_RANTA